MITEKWVSEYSSKYEWLHIDTLQKIERYEATSKSLGEDMGFRTIGVYDSRDEAEREALRYVDTERPALSESSTISMNNIRSKLKNY